MDAFGLPEASSVQKYVFNGNSQSAGASWHTWNKPLGKSMAMFVLIGGGGGGGTGVVGANSTAAGGGGGGSGGMTIAKIPLDLLPPRLYVSVGQAKTGAGVASYVSTQPNIAAQQVLFIANGGGAGGNATAGTGGAAGSGAAIAAATSASLGWAFVQLPLAGQNGIIGGAAVSGAALTYPTTGLRVTGGTGGGGLPAAAAAGTSGGAITAIASPGYFQGVIGGAGSATATAPAANGQNGTQIPEAGFYFRGGTGAASTHGTATGGGLVQGRGGDGGIGCGGGGNGGALTGSTVAARSNGGAGLVMIYCY